MEQTPTDTRFFCRQCSLGDCFGHVHEFLNRDNQVAICRCPDPQNHHGKLRPRKRCDNCGQSKLATDVIDVTSEATDPEWASKWTERDRYLIEALCLECRAIEAAAGIVHTPVTQQ